MLSRNTLKFIQSLKLRKNREQHKLFVAEGVKVVDELLAGDIVVRELYAVDGWYPPKDLLKRFSGELVRISDKDLERISGLQTPNQVLAIAEIPVYSMLPMLAHERVLFLDQIRDPGNLGTIIRTAEWFGIRKVFCSLNTVDCWNHKVIQASMGSIFRVQLSYVDTARFLSSLSPALPVYGAYLDGEPLSETELTPEGVIVIGSESHGISAEAAGFITRRITIPGGRQTESLNAAIAAAVICYEFQRREKRQ